MKKSILNSICVAAFALSAASCNDFLDVQPKGTLTEDVQFKPTQGYYDAMYGVYSKMASTDLYGGNLSYGFVDKIGQLFGKLNTNETDTEILKYDYQNSKVRAIIDNIWKSQYEGISYVNNVIKNVESTSLHDKNLQLVRGEAYGLRAFLHFDLVRLFCPDYRTNPNAEYGVPYAESFNLANKNVYTLKGTYEHILQDLNTAENLLANDTVVTPIVEVGSDYDNGRARQFNLYAVYATKARVYYTMGDNEKAAEYAKKVIDAKQNFSLTASTDFEKVRRFPADREMIFGLNNRTLSQSVYNTFVGLIQRSGNFTEGRRDIEKLYETKTFNSNNIDVRYSAFYRMEVGASIFLRFVANESESRSTAFQGLTLVRLPEMYYILAESLYDTNPKAAKAVLDEVRKSRGLQPSDDAKFLTKDAFLQEMLNERMREMPGEGQVFYAIKHYNKPFKALDGRTTIEPSPARFVLPRPDRELEFGNKQQ